MGVLVGEHLLLLTAAAATLLAADLLRLLPCGGFALVLALEDRLRQHPPREPAVVLAAARLADFHRDAARLVREADDRRRLVRLLSARPPAEDEALLKVVLVDGRLRHQLANRLYFFGTDHVAPIVSMPSA